MSQSPVDPSLDPCGCCESEQQPEKRENRPGQPALNYRIGTHSAFLPRMLARIAKQTIPDGGNQGARPLAELTARTPDDPAIALLDAWATTADVLTFYQERIANESYLRTATERRSILELARAVGYELGPGVAAETYLAFTVDEAEGAPGEASIPIGAQVQSIPTGQGELPQTFETVEALTARAEWNAIHPALTSPQDIALTSTEIYLQGTTTQLKPGDVLLLVAGITAAPRHIENVKEIDEDGITLVSLEPVPSFEAIGHDKPSSPGRAGASSEILKRLMGVDPLPFSGQNVEKLFMQTLSESQLRAILEMNRWSAQNVLAYLGQAASLPGAGTTSIFAMRETAAIFGHNAPYYKSLPDSMRSTGGIAETGKAYPYDWDSSSGWSIWKDSLTGTNYNGAHFYLDRSIPGIVKGSWIVLERPEGFYLACQVDDTSEGSLTGFGISAKTTGLKLSEGSRPPGFKVRQTTAYVKSEEMIPAELPIRDDLAAGSTTITLDNVILGLQVGQAVLLTGEQADGAGVERSEILFLDEITHGPGHVTVLRLKHKLAHSYVRRTVTLNANVVRATHGETVAEEVLGSGDGALVNQAFRLKKPPLTHLSSASASGAESTLSIRVDGIEWEQAPSLFCADSKDKCYVIRIDNEGRASVTFGDGRQGARLPTGQENIVATYRSGIGSAGEVGPGSLTLLKTRPFGVRGVTNPLPATGAADPETLDDARENAPLTVLTMDRIVSLQDYEDFCRAFAGIGKAKAAAFWSGENQVVHITIADANGDEILPTTTLYENLLGAINAARDPLQEAQLGSFQPIYFNVAAKLLIDAAYEADKVLFNAETALRDHFSFERRQFSQPVTAAEIVSLLHTVDGVIAVDLDALHTISQTGDLIGSSLASVLWAKAAERDRATGRIQSAELLLINAPGISLTEMKP